MERLTTHAKSNIICLNARSQILGGHTNGQPARGKLTSFVELYYDTFANFLLSPILFRNQTLPKTYEDRSAVQTPQRNNNDPAGFVLQLWQMLQQVDAQ